VRFVDRIITNQVSVGYCPSGDKTIYTKFTCPGSAVLTDPEGRLVVVCPYTNLGRPSEDEALGMEGVQDPNTIEDINNGLAPLAIDGTYFFLDLPSPKTAAKWKPPKLIYPEGVGGEDIQWSAGDMNIPEGDYETILEQRLLMAESFYARDI
jgi:hypothetical protein